MLIFCLSASCPSLFSILYEQGELTIDAATQLFGYFIIFVGEHKEIKKCIEWMRTDNTDTYGNFEYIYDKVKILDNNNV